MTLDELEAQIAATVDPKKLLGNDPEHQLNVLRAVCRSNRDQRQEARGRAALQALQAIAEQARQPPLILNSPQREYALIERLGTGDVSDVWLGRWTDKSYVVKMSRIREGASLLDVERDAVAALLTRAGDSHYRRYFPLLAESFPIRDVFPKQANVYVFESGFYTLEQVHEQHPALDGRHLGWIFKRLLTAIGFAHQAGWLHGAIVPVHVMLQTEEHGLRLAGWAHAARPGQRIQTGSAKYANWQPPEVAHRESAGPATDIYLAAKCMIYLAGGDPVAERIPDAIPREMAAFFKACLLEGLRMRPDDAWDLHDEFDELLSDLYGPPQFHSLTMRGGLAS